jgi:hypothetical protein
MVDGSAITRRSRRWWELVKTGGSAGGRSVAAACAALLIRTREPTQRWTARAARAHFIGIVLDRPAR